MYIFDKQKLAETPTYKELEAKKELIKLSFINGRSMREQITHGFMVHKNTGVIPSHIQGVNRKLINDLIEMDQVNQGSNETH